MTVRAIALAVALAISSSAFANAPPDAVENILAVYLDGKEVIPTTVLQQSADGDVWLEVEDWERFSGLNLSSTARRAWCRPAAWAWSPRSCPSAKPST